ncbi:MAG TPA: hypothetical protein VNR64_09130 [Vicinamibacterales bacterium]|nr:hypothetical protein [Vicinamibacterales bacterium]
MYRRGAQIPMDKYEALVLLVCTECAEETDGYEGSNGFQTRFTDGPAVERLLSGFPRLLRANRFFDAVPTGEPSDAKAFEAWRPKKVPPKLGGRQLSIQAPREQPKCRQCGGRMVFVGSIPERWGDRRLNFGGGMGYTFACERECGPRSAFFYWDCP